MKRNKAMSSIQVDNKLVRVTKYSFFPDEETRMHKHLYDYIVTPVTDGKLLLSSYLSLKFLYLDFVITFYQKVLHY